MVLEVVIEYKPRSPTRADWRPGSFVINARLVRGSIIYGPDLFEANPDLPMLLAEGKGCADIGNEYLLKNVLKKYMGVCLAKCYPSSYQRSDRNHRRF